MLVDNGADVNAQGGKYGNALYAASAKGYQEIVQILVDNKADVNAQGGFYGKDNALYTASERGHQEIVQLLLDTRKDDKDINLKRSMSPLFAVDGDQKKSSVVIQRQPNKRKYIELGQESITKKPCI
ncbi:hypothetical protein E8E14_000940 [Neopestalotiopsis sp. 37M]|nr:hypothetical protein E8E14_000940 [Neopestalotiopsis sp. 37M]